MRHAQALVMTLLSTLGLVAGQADFGNFPLHPQDGVPKSFWRLPCRGQSGIGRIDPLMDPGEVGAHVHTISGGNGFGFNATFESLKHSTCTSCAVKEDKSAYWTPTLHFIYANGTTVMVEQVGGMLAYYKSFGDTLPFPEGFRMIVGNKDVRNFTGPFPDVPTSETSVWKDDPEEVATPEQQFFLSQRAIGFNCLNYYGAANEGSLYRHQLPTKPYMDQHCVDGIRIELAFPTCNNGSIDAEDHRSHMAFPSLVQQGTCPKGFGTRYPLLFYETNYNTWAFAGADGQFLLSYGDPIGTGYHGDFVMGWDSEDILKRAMDDCRSMSGQVEDCPLFTLQSEEAQEQCHFAVPRALMDDNPTGPRNGLAVDIPIQYGPQQATKYDIPGQSGVTTKTFKPSPPPRSFVGNLSVHPYGDFANPTLMSAASAGRAINVTSALASTPLVTWMPALTSVSYISGVIAPEFSKYLTALPGESVNDPAGGIEGQTSASNESDAKASCDATTDRQPISLITSLSTVGDQVVEYLIEDIQFVITTRITTTIAARTSSVHSTADLDQSNEPSVTKTSEPKTSSPTGAMTGPNMFNTIMWVMGTNTYRTPPLDFQHHTSNGNPATHTTKDGLRPDGGTSRGTALAETTPA